MAPDIVVTSSQPNDDVERLGKILSRYSYTGLASFLTTRFELGTDAEGDLAIGLFVIVPDRDGSVSDEFASSWTMPAAWFRAAADIEIRHLLEKEFQRLWFHEFEESVRYQGELIKDPHRWEDVVRYHDELLQAEYQRKLGQAADAGA